jgi:hypothetical protein
MSTATQTPSPFTQNRQQDATTGYGSPSSMQQQHRHEHSEGMLARMIEEQTAKLPSDLFLWAALGSIGCSLFLQATNKKEESLFVGQWAPTFLILGLYNKIVKVAGSDEESHSRR